MPALPSKTPPSGASVPASPVGNDRPTVVPAFDPEAFARDSEVKQRVAIGQQHEPTIEQARQLHLEGKHEEALSRLACLLDLAPLHAEATKLSLECQEALEQECLLSIGSASAILVSAVSPDELKDFALDNVSGFLLSLTDGATEVGTVLDLSGLPRLLALRRLRDLVDCGILVVGSRMQRVR